MGGKIYAYYRNIYNPTKKRDKRNPSTSGTASEITGCYVITDTTTHAKYPIVSYELTPDVTILDIELPAKMPKSITV